MFHQGVAQKFFAQAVFPLIVLRNDKINLILEVYHQNQNLIFYF